MPNNLKTNALGNYGGNSHNVQPGASPRDDCKQTDRLGCGLHTVIKNFHSICVSYHLRAHNCTYKWTTRPRYIKSTAKLLGNNWVKT